jgi:hypothetical protein
LGKPGFAYLKKLIFGYLKPPADVSPARHRVGIVMFVAAMLFGWLEPHGFFPAGVAGGGIRYSLAVDGGCWWRAS